MNQLTRHINKASALFASGCFLFSSVVLFTLSGCEKYLEMPVKDKMPQDVLFSNEQGFMDALTGVYLGMDKTNGGPSRGLYTRDLSLGMLSVMANNYTNANQFILDDGMYKSVANYDYAQSTVKQEISFIWAGMYNNIANVNNLLGKIDGKKDLFSRDHYQRVKGEALALRALFHFDLARLYGKSPVTGLNEKAIPYVTKFGAGSTPFVTLNVALDSCISDLNKAKSLLANADTTSLQEGSLDLISGYSQNHLNYWATKALLARV